MNKNQNWFNILMIILQNFTKKSQILKLVLCDWIECEYSEFTNQSSFQSNSDSYIDWVENTWLIMKAMNISIDTLNCLTQKMTSFERQQIQSSQYWVWICDLWTFYHLFWNKMTDYKPQERQDLEELYRKQNVRIYELEQENKYLEEELSDLRMRID